MAASVAGREVGCLWLSFGSGHHRDERRQQREIHLVAIPAPRITRLLGWYSSCLADHCDWLFGLWLVPQHSGCSRCAGT
jgi:hypothetical protein